MGGRLAACSDNLVRNITRTRVNDTSGAGIGMSWGEHLQNTIATGNMIRDCNMGLEASTTDGAGKAVIAKILFQGPKEAASSA